jgi:hypothetical protein
MIMILPPWALHRPHREQHDSLTAAISTLARPSLIAITRPFSRMGYLTHPSRAG